MKTKLHFIIILCLSAFFVNAQSTTATDYLTGLSNPRGLAFDSNGVLYVAEYTSGNIYKVTASETSTVFINTGWYNNNIAFDASGNLYTGDDFFNQIFQINASGTSQATYLNKSNNGVSSPWAIEFDAAGNLYYSSTNANKIVKVTPAKVSTDYATGFFTPEGMAFDSNGNLYVADRNDRTLIKVDATGTKTTLLSNLAEIRSVAVDANDKVYYNVRIGFSTYKIIKYDPVDGSQTDIVDSGITGGVNELAFNAAGDLFIAQDDKVSIVTGVLSNKDFVKNEDFKIFPNPATNYIKVSDKISSYKIYSVTGKEITSGNSLDNSIDVSILNRGVYLINLKDINGIQVTKKLIKN